MKLVIQRVTRASVEADGVLSGEIGPGLMVLLGIELGDTLEQVNQLATKLLKIRLWPDLKDPTKQWASSVVDNGYGILVVSQFTLFATFKKPKPDFHLAMGGDQAKALYEAFVERLRAESSPERVATGVFGAMMKVDLCNDGPVTVELVAESNARQEAAASSPSASASASASQGGGASPSKSKPGKAPSSTSAPRALTGSQAAELEELLNLQPYVAGYLPTSADRELYEALSTPGTDRPRTPNLLRWYEHVGSFTAAQRAQWP